MLVTVRKILFMILGTMALPVLANDPGEAALAFLEKARIGKVDLEPGKDTALKPHTTQGKRDTIARLLENLSLEIGDSKLELGTIRKEGNYAAVMIHQGSVFDETKVRVFPVAMVKEKSGWVAAPVLASFENAVLAYSISAKKKLSGLESWMMRQRVLELEKLMGSTEARARRTIEEALPEEALKSDDLVDLLESFREACLARNQAKVLAFLGGLSKPWAEDWEARLAAAQVAVSKDNRKDYPWRLLVSPQVIRVPVEVDRTEKDGIVSIACLDPALGNGGGVPKGIHLLHFRFEKNKNGLWYVDLPPALRNDDSEQLLTDGALDAGLLKEFGRRLRKSAPLIAAKSALEAEGDVMHVLENGSLDELLRRVEFSSDKPEQTNAACVAAADIWWTTNEPGVFRSPVRLGFREEAEIAVAAYQWFSVKRPDRFELKLLIFKKTDAGWIWCPGMELGEKEEKYQVFSDWLAEKEEPWRNTWREILIEPSLKLEDFASDREATDEEVRGVIRQWFKVLREKNIRAALALTAWSGGKQRLPVKAMRNLAYELEGAMHGSIEIIGIYRSESWTAAGVLRRDGERTKYQFIPVIPTAKTPRILPEVDLIAGSGRTRDFLNEASFEQLTPLVDKKRLQELKELFRKFQKEVEEKQ
jgi:hypothetical protein